MFQHPLVIAIGLMRAYCLPNCRTAVEMVFSEPSVASPCRAIIFWYCSFGTLIGLCVLLTGWLLGLSAVAIRLYVDGAESLSRGVDYVLIVRRTFYHFDLHHADFKGVDISHGGA
ncbi:MAG: hypothetical protein U0936_23690 [Planctomycetaceae bacterium]